MNIPLDSKLFRSAGLRLGSLLALVMASPARPATGAARSAIVTSRLGAPTRPAKAPAVLFALEGGSWITQDVDPLYKKRLNDLGYQVGTAQISSLKWDKLKQFNVLVLHHLPPDIPQSGGPRGSVIFGAKLPLIQRFLNAGGGIMLLHDESYDQVFPTANLLLAPLGAHIINEEVTDPEHIWRQPGYLEYYYGWTRQIAPSPISEGIKTVWYPIGYSPRDDRKTCTFDAGRRWQVVVKAGASAYSYRSKSSTGMTGLVKPVRTYSSAPPLVAIRSVGAGRFVLFPSSSSFTVQSGFHPIWQRIVLSRGNGLIQSDTGKLLENAIQWLAEPSAASQELGGYHQPPTPPNRPDPAPRYTPESQPAYEQHQFPGLIGIHSAFSDGTGSVDQWADAARAGGYRFIAFTEAFPEMTAAKWKQETADCQRLSDKDFLAMAGISYQDSDGNRYCSFAFPIWPKSEWLTSDGNRVQDTPGWYFGANWPPLAVMDASHNPTPPWLLKFYGGLGIYTYHAGTPGPAGPGVRPAGYRAGASPVRFDPAPALDSWTDQARTDYLRLMANQYNSVPMAIHELYAPRQIAAARGFKTIAWAARLQDIPNSLHHVWYAQPQGAYITSGPRIQSWWIENGVSGNGTPDNSAIPWRLHVDVTSKTPLKEVRIMDGERLFRRFRVSGRRFHRVIEGLHDRQRYFVLIATDTAGRQAISPSLRTAVSRHSIYMCTDMQNTLECGVMRDRAGHWTYAGMLGNYVTGWDALNLGILVPGDEIMPQGLDYVVNGFNGGAGQMVHSVDGSESSVAARNIAFGSGDAVILDNDFRYTFGPHGESVPTRLARSAARYLSYTMRLYSSNLLLIRRETTFLKDVKMADGPFPELQTLSISGPDTSFKHFAYTGPGGNMVTGDRPAGNAAWLKPAVIPAGGFVAMYPDFYGSVAVFPLSGPAEASGTGAGFAFGYDLAGRTIAAGSRFSQEFLVMRAPFGDSSARSFERVQSLYGLNGPPAYHLTLATGRFIEHRFALHLRADQGSARFKLTPAPLPSDLPLQIDGLHDRWMTVMVDAKTGAWRPIGTLDGTAYAGIDLNHGARDIFIGHPFICSRPDLFLSLVPSSNAGPGSKTIELVIHNPLDTAVTAVVRSNPRCPGLRPWIIRVTITAGSSIHRRVPTSGLATGRWLVD